MGRIGSWVPRHCMSAALAPHCWNATSLADPEYVMDLRSPKAFCAFAMTAFASCAIALPHTNARQLEKPATLFNTVFPLLIWLPAARAGLEYFISSRFPGGLRSTSGILVWCPA